MDKFQFLQRQENGEALDDAYYFRHISIMNAIYESISFEQRDKMHELVAIYYEEQLNDETMEVFLPLVSFHYAKTSKVPKMLLYMEKLGYIHFCNCHYREAQNALETLKKLGESLTGHGDPSLYMSLVEQGLQDVMEPLRVADWIAHLSYTMTQQKKPAGVIEMCLEAFKLVDYNITMDIKKAKIATIKNLLKLRKLWKATEGGRIPLRITLPNKQVIEAEYLAAGLTGHYKMDSTCGGSKCVDCPKFRRVHSLGARAMVSAGIMTSGIPQPVFAVILTENCLAEIKTGAVDTGEWINVCYRFGYGTYTSQPALSKILLRRAYQMEMERDFDGRSCANHHLVGMVEFAQGNLTQSHNSFDNACKFHAAVGDVHNLLGKAKKQIQLNYMRDVLIFNIKQLRI
jgi:hypothetical protein